MDLGASGPEVFPSRMARQRMAGTIALRCPRPERAEEKRDEFDECRGKMSHNDVANNILVRQSDHAVICRARENLQQFSDLIMTGENDCKKNASLEKQFSRQDGCFGRRRHR
jgi:hypothetical protein